MRQKRDELTETLRNPPGERRFWKRFLQFRRQGATGKGFRAKPAPPEIQGVGWLETLAKLLRSTG